MAKKETDRFVKVLAENGFVTSSEIWVDTQTGVEYLYHASGNFRRPHRPCGRRGQAPAAPPLPGCPGV